MKPTEEQLSESFEFELNDGTSLEFKLGEIRKYQEVYEHLKNRIEELDKIIKREETNLKNITDGFQDYTYRYIAKIKDQRKELQKILENKE